MSFAHCIYILLSLTVLGMPGMVSDYLAYIKHSHTRIDKTNVSLTTV